MWLVAGRVRAARKRSTATSLLHNGTTTPRLVLLLFLNPAPLVPPSSPCPRQANIYVPDRTFHSFKKIVRQLDAPCPLVSLHSTSKGFVGECGRRGGYMEVVNFPPEIHEMVRGSLHACMEAAVLHTGACSMRRTSSASSSAAARGACGSLRAGCLFYHFDPL